MTWPFEISTPRSDPEQARPHERVKECCFFSDVFVRMIDAN